MAHSQGACGLWILLAWLSLTAAQTLGQDAAQADLRPILRLEPGGPTSYVSSLAFDPTGNTLYAGGFDKLVRAWTFDPARNDYVLNPRAGFRVPVGPGLWGAINAVALSPDGTWLAAAGQGMVRGATDLWHVGKKVPSSSVSPQMLEDLGTIYVLNTRTREVKVLKKHRAPVISLAFAAAMAGKPPLLVSVDQEPAVADGGRANAAGVAWTWNVEDAKPLDGLTLQVPDRSVSGLGVGLAAWHTGAEPKQVAVAIALPDKLLRVWDLTARTIQPFREDKFNNQSVAWWPGANQKESWLITGSFRRLRRWNATTANVKPDGDLPLDAIPRAISLFASAAGGPIDRAAVAVTRVNGAQQTLGLLFVDLNRFQVVGQAAGIAWNGLGVSPALAAAAGGLVAIAGNQQHEIAVGSAAELIAGKPAPQRLRGMGLSTPFVANFVAKQGELGVHVGVKGGKAAAGALPVTPAAGDLVLDPGRSRFSSELDGWQLSRPANAGWTMRVVENRGVAVTQAGQPPRQVAVPPGFVITDAALLAPQPPLNRPLVAIATIAIGDLMGEPILRIYDVSTGALLRDLMGHVAPIRSLAFSADGKRLVTAAADRTICLWKTDDLDKVVGAFGAVPDITFEEQQPLVIKSIAAGPNAKLLKPGDTLVAWKSDAGPRPIEDPLDFHRALFDLKPGATIKLDGKRGGQPAELQIVVGQGTDVRQPLASVFLATPHPGQPYWDWIGWDPTGPFESSGPEADKLLGWQFNGDLSRFADLGQYQQDRTPLLIYELLSGQRLPDRDRVRIEVPTINLRLRPSEPGLDVSYEHDRQLILLGRAADVEVSILDLDPQDIDTVTYQAGDAPPTTLSKSSDVDGLWSARLEGLGAERDELPFAIEVTIREEAPRRFTRRTTLVHRPPAPYFERINLKEDEPNRAESPTFKLDAVARSREGDGAALVVTLEHRAGDEIVPPAKNTFEGGAVVEIPQEITLKPGDNTITLIAANLNRRAGDPREQATLVRRIFYDPKQVAPPELQLRVTTADGDLEQPLTGDAAETLVVDNPQLLLEGTILGIAGPLVEADWQLAGKPTGQQGTFNNFAPGKVKQFKVNQPLPIKLEPHQPYEIRCRAKTEGSLPTERRLTVEYRPRLPRLTLTQLAEKVIDDGRGLPALKVSARLDPPAEPNTIKADILLNGKVVSEGLDVQGANFTAQIDLRQSPGGLQRDNEVEVRLSNRWNSQIREFAQVTYLRPPRILALSVPDAVNEPPFDVQIVIETPDDPALALGVLTANGKDLSPLAKPAADQPREGIKRWTVAGQIPVQLNDAGQGEIQVLARNGDGPAVENKLISVGPRLAAQAARIRFFRPGTQTEIEEDTTLADEIEVDYEISSLRRLEQVQLRGQDLNLAADVNQQQTDQAGQFVLRQRQKLKLRTGSNRLVIRADDGIAIERPLVVSRPALPVALAINNLEQKSGRLRYANVTDNELRLEGTVEWPDEDTPARVGQRGRPRLLVWVNGMLQPSLPLANQDGRQWSFKAPIRLNGAENEICVNVAGAPNEEASPSIFNVACSTPDKAQRLHLLVVGINESDGKRIKQLETLALAAVQAERRASGQLVSYESPDEADLDAGAEIRIPSRVFSRGWLYRLNGHVRKQTVLNQLRFIDERIHAQVPAGGSDVVMIYYRGEETIDRQNNDVLLHTSLLPLSERISRGDLSGVFRNTPGAQVLLLDVERAQPEDASPERNARQMAVLRYAWLQNYNWPANRPPEDQRLLSALSRAVPEAARLGQIKQQVRAQSLTINKAYRNRPVALNYEQLGDALDNLVLATPKGGVQNP